MKKLFSEPTADCSTLVEILGWRAEHQPERQAYTFLVDGETEEVSVTYKALNRQVQAAAAKLQSLGRIGDRAILLYPPGPEFIAAYLGCLYSGIIAIPLYPPHPVRLEQTMPKIMAVLNDAQPLIALTTSRFLDRAGDSLMQYPGMNTMCWLATDEIDEELADKWEEPDINSNSIAFLQYTSGSTTQPRGVMVSHGNLMYNLHLIEKCFEHSPETRGVIWLPSYHDMGLVGGILQPLYCGFHIVLMSPLIFLQRPFRWLQAISRYRATTSGGPNFAYDLCVRKITPEQRKTLDLSSWDMAFNGAEPINHETLDRFTEYFEPCGFRREAFYPCYGLAEATLIVSGGFKTAPPIVRGFQSSALEQNQVVIDAANNESSRLLVSCGQTMAGQEIVIADPVTLKQCPADRIGEIWIAGPSVARGYWNRQNETNHTFKGYLADTNKGPFLRTGDLGFLRDGELFVTGRLKDLIIIDGSNHYPQDIEWTVERSHEALRASGCAAFSIDVHDKEQLVVAVEVEPRYQLKRFSKNKDITHDKQYNNSKHRLLLDFNEVVMTIRKAVAEQYDLRVYDIRLLKAGRIPKTSSGKIQRHTCKAQYLAGTLDILEV
ncbi:MAG: fatty acyl-AMP ligase [Candidatus Aminicenantes bacterium]|nr:MAG: fatty acyl-AMP ligase [Candidatus Aminicenantes bacterium]